MGLTRGTGRRCCRQHCPRRHGEEETSRRENSGSRRACGLFSSLKAIAFYIGAVQSVNISIYVEFKSSQILKSPLPGTKGKKIHAFPALSGVSATCWTDSVLRYTVRDSYYECCLGKRPSQ